MTRIGILTAGGDTPALNATIHGAVTRACQRKVEVLGFIKGFSSLFNPRVPYIHLNPLYSPIPELDPTLGGSLIGASRDYVSADDKASVSLIADRLKRLGVEGLVCIGGDGTLNGMQALCECLPTVLAPKSRNRQAGELLGAGVPAAKIQSRIGQASEGLDSVPLIARTVSAAGVEAPSLEGLADLIEGEIDPAEWVAGLRRAERARKAA